MIPYLFCLCVAGLIHFKIKKRGKQTFQLQQLYPFTATIFVYSIVKVLEQGLILTNLKTSDFEIVTPVYPLVIIGILFGSMAFSNNEEK